MSKHLAWAAPVVALLGIVAAVLGLVTSSKNLWLVVALVLFALVAAALAASTTRIGKTTKKIRPHVHTEGDVYCLYTIKASHGGGLKQGDELCLYCPSSDTTHKCPTIDEAHISDDLYYELELSHSEICTDCDSKHYYEEVK